MMVLTPSPGFSFLVAQVGVDDPSEYLQNLPAIDFVYCAPPNPDSMSFWARLAGTRRLTYGQFFESFAKILDVVDASEVHLEVGRCRPFVEEWATKKGFPYQAESVTTYAAPTTARGKGMTRTKRTFARLSFGKSPLEDTSAGSSDSFLDTILANRPPMVCFDPCIGRGLLSRYALKHGHTCHGIELNMERASAAAAFVRDHT